MLAGSAGSRAGARVSQAVSRLLVMAASVAAASVTTTATVSRKCMFPAAFVGSLAHVAPTIACLIGIEMIEAL